MNFRLQQDLIKIVWKCYDVYLHSLVAAGLTISNDGRAIAYCSWGDGVSVPTIAVFDTNVTTGPVYSLVTPGSMTSIDVITEDDIAYVTAGGKHVHANVIILFKMIII